MQKLGWWCSKGIGELNAARKVYKNATTCYYTERFIGTSIKCSVNGHLLHNYMHEAKGSGTLSILKCPWEIYVFGMCNNCPHPYITIKCKAYLDRTLHVQSRAFRMRSNLHRTLWEKQKMLHTDWSQSRQGFILGRLIYIHIRAPENEYKKPSPLWSPRVGCRLWGLF